MENIQKAAGFRLRKRLFNRVRIRFRFRESLFIRVRAEDA